jgi:hypothetical protein
VRKSVKIRFTSARKKARASKVRKVVERDMAWSWLLVGNSIYLNGDVGIKPTTIAMTKFILVRIVLKLNLSFIRLSRLIYLTWDPKMTLAI